NPNHHLWRRCDHPGPPGRRDHLHHSRNGDRGLYAALDDRAGADHPVGCPFCAPRRIRFFRRLGKTFRIPGMTASALKTHGLTRRFGGNMVSDDINLDIIEGEVHAVIGPNGAGKTTLINQLIGELEPDAGRIEFFGRDITDLPVYRRALFGLSRSYQITSVFHDFSAIENVAIAAQAHDGHSFGCWDPAAQDGRLTALAEASLDKVGLTAKASSYAAELAHGERRQLELAMALVSKSRILLLDEPMAGMGTRE